jgi:hypothetical protein
MNKPIIHGENVLIPVGNIPEGKTESHTSYIVGHSETGHHHVLEAEKQSPFDIIIVGEDMYISSKQVSSLVHKKSHDIHKTVVVEPGFYQVKRKTEYDPFSKAIRQVWD